MALFQPGFIDDDSSNIDESSLTIIAILSFLSALSTISIRSSICFDSISKVDMTCYDNNKSYFYIFLLLHVSDYLFTKIYLHRHPKKFIRKCHLFL